MNISVSSALRGRLHLELRQSIGPVAKFQVLLASFLFGLLVSAIILVASGVSAGDLWNEFVVYIATSPKNLSAVLLQSVPLTIAGLAAAAAFRARFWNIGIEGQMIFGTIAATYIAIHDIGPESMRLGLMFAAAACGGTGWILLPVFLKVRLQVNEIISTLLMNYIAVNFLLHLLYGPWKDPVSAFPTSQQFDATEVLPLLGWQSLNLSLVPALLLVAVTFWLFMFSRFGFILKVLHGNSEMALSLGIRVGLMVLLAAILSGALAGICGLVISAGTENRMTQSFFVGFGFSGVLIAFLARNNPLGVVIVSLLFANLVIGGQSLQVFYQIPFAMVQLIQAIIVMCVAASEFLVRYRIVAPG